MSYADRTPRGPTLQGISDSEVYYQLVHGVTVDERREVMLCKKERKKVEKV